MPSSDKAKKSAVKRKQPTGNAKNRQKAASAIPASPLEISTLLLQYFVGRADHVAVATHHGFSPEPLTERLSVERLANEHLSCQNCLGFYIMQPSNQVSVSCLDFDDKPERPDPAIRNKVRAVAGCLHSVGIAPLVEVSQSGRGVHVWIFLDSPVPAWKVRGFWKGLLAHLGQNVPEIYPRQDQLTGKGLGNLIRYPLFGQSRFVNVASTEWPSIAPLKALGSIKTVNSAMLDDVATRLGFPLQPGKTTATVKIAAANVAASIPPRVQALLRDSESWLARRWRGDTTGMDDTTRSALVFAIAVSLVMHRIAPDEVTASVKAWCELNNYEKGDRPEWIEHQVNAAYEWVRQKDASRNEAQGHQSPGMSASMQKLIWRAIYARKRQIERGIK